jgi:hypothetical protein
MVQSDVSCSPIDVLQQQLIAMRQHHFGTGFRGQALAVQEGAIPENCGRIQSAKKLAAHRLACKKNMHLIDLTIRLDLLAKIWI